MAPSSSEMEAFLRSTDIEHLCTHADWEQAGVPDGKNNKVLVRITYTGGTNPISFFGFIETLEAGEFDVTGMVREDSRRSQFGDDMQLTIPFPPRKGIKEDPLWTRMIMLNGWAKPPWKNMEIIYEALGLECGGNVCSNDYFWRCDPEANNRGWSLRLRPSLSRDVSSTFEFQVKRKRHQTMTLGEKAWMTVCELSSALPKGLTIAPVNCTEWMAENGVVLKTGK